MTSNEIIKFKCLKVTQPLGEFFIGAINSKDLCKIAYADVRRVEQENTRGDFETYLGIQRQLSERRVKEIAKYANTPDACFPTAVILAIPPECVTYDKEQNEISLMPYEDGDVEIPVGEIAKIIDGQHRIEGLKDYQGDNFYVNVSIFVGMDVSDQAYLFSTVNLAQTKVNKSLVYDLFELAKHRSPQKVCHNIAVALDKNSKSPFYRRIKRLGVATDGRFSETITQSTFVESLLKYITKDAVLDRSMYLKGKKPTLTSADEEEKLFLRRLFIDEKDLEIADIIWNYFDAVKNRWPTGWENVSKGNVLNQTMGFKAFMRLLRPVYMKISAPGKVPETERFLELLKKVKAEDSHFSVENYQPGASGEGALYKYLKESISD